MRGEVAGEQDEVDAVAQPGERRGPALVVAVAAEVDVAGRRDPDRALVGLSRPASFSERMAMSGAYPGTSRPCPSDEQPFADIEATLKKSAAALRGADVPFLLGGSLASWARGGPETRHDLDLMIKREDVERAVAGADGSRHARRGSAGGVARQGMGR